MHYAMLSNLHCTTYQETINVVDKVNEDLIEPLLHIAKVAASHSCREKEKRAVSQFNRFLQEYLPLAQSKHHPEHPTFADQVYLSDLTDALFGKFATFLTQNATAYGRLNGAPLSMNTTVGYFSSIKVRRIIYSI